MSNAKIINKEVEVNAFYFSSGKPVRSFPKAITLERRSYAFRDGLQMLVRQGQRAFKIFNMTDGTTNYHLKQEGSVWTLLGLEPAL